MPVLRHPHRTAVRSREHGRTARAVEQDRNRPLFPAGYPKANDGPAIGEKAVAQEFELINCGDRIDEPSGPGVEVARVADIDGGYQLGQRALPPSPSNGLPVIGQPPSGIEGHAEAAHLASGDQRLEAKLARHRVDMVGFPDEHPWIGWAIDDPKREPLSFIT